MKKLFLLIACVIALQGCSYFVSRQEQSLARSGFEVLAADTPEREAKLASLPPNEFVREGQGTQITYTYADPVVCHCLYVGSEQEYEAFRRITLGDAMGGLVDRGFYPQPQNVMAN